MVPEPGPWVDRVPITPDFEVKLRFRLCRCAGGRNDLARCDGFPGSLVKPLIMSVQAQVSLAVVDNRQQPEPGEPVRVNHAAG